MNRFESIKENLEKQLKHHSVEELAHDLSDMKKEHPESEKLGSFKEEHDSETKAHEHEEELAHWGVPRH